MTDSDRELLDEILSVPFIFWTCPVCVNPEVRWVNAGLWAVCMSCGRTSKKEVEHVANDSQGRGLIIVRSH
jgi:ribosomal protein L37AE/L43A